MISEKQLAKLIVKRGEVAEQDSSPDKPTSSAAGSSSSSSPSGDIGTSPDAKDYPPYPETTKWESGVARGAANQIATNSKWSDVVGSKLTRGHANPLK
jgi:hypothetical protein